MMNRDQGSVVRDQQCPEMLRRLLDREEARRSRPAVRRASFLNCASVFTPTDRQLRNISDFILRSGRAADLLLKTAVVSVALYFAFEVVNAFMPGGAVDRVLGGGQ